MTTVPSHAVYDVIVLGAGASGLMCARAASGRGLSVLIVDHGSRAGRKLSITGGGKCNLTNRRVEEKDYIGGNPGFWRSALARFGTEHMLVLAEEAGIVLEEREQGQLFCARSAKDVVRLLVHDCLKGGCVFAFDTRIQSAERTAAPANPARFQVQCSQGTYAGRNLVIATGGPAWPQVGGTGIGYELAKSFGHKVRPIRPALAGLVMPPQWPLAGLAGLSADVSLWVRDAGRNLPPPGGKKGGKKGGEQAVMAAEKLALLFTHKGVSGPAALQASLYWRKGREVVIDFLPSERASDLLVLPEHGKLLCRNFLRRYLPERLCTALLPEELGGKRCAEFSRDDRKRLDGLVHAHVVVPQGTEGFAKAEVTAGGVDTRDVSSKSMESALAPGLFFCGEVLDVTGRLGGYNLHWAFASGNAAGMAVV